MKFKGVLAVSIAVLLLAACEEPHRHVYSDEFSFDSVHHWREALCADAEEKEDFGAHIFQDGKCAVCGYEKEIVYPTSSLFLTETSPASGEDLQRAQTLLNECAEFAKGDLSIKEHVAEGSNAQNLEAKIEDFEGVHSVPARASLTKILPAYGGTRKLSYYADDTCAAEDLGGERNWYRAEGTVSYLLEDVFHEIESQMNFASVLIRSDSEIGYKSGEFEIVRVKDLQSSEYVFLFKDDALWGFRAYRNYVSGVATQKQLELLIGDYPIEKPDERLYQILDRKPKWAAGFPTEEIFSGEFSSADAMILREISDLFKGTVSKLNRSDNTDILASGDIYYRYKAGSSENEISFDRDDMGMKVFERSKGLLTDVSESENGVIEHYVDVGVCYEVLNGRAEAFLGSYADKFYSMLFYTLRQLCEFEAQYLNAVSEGHPEAYHVSVSLTEFTAIKLSVEDCGEMIYVYDEDGKLVAIDIKLNQTEATLLIGAYNVTIPVFSDCKFGTDGPEIGYLGI